MRLESTPLIIKQLIIVTVVTSLLCATVQLILDGIGIFPGPQDLLSLSWWGISSGFIWQPFTYMFVDAKTTGLSFSYLFGLVFNMYILWMIGTSVLELIGKTSFINFYVGSGALSGIVGIIFVLITGQYVHFASSTTPLIALFTLWGMAFPEVEILLLFSVSLKTKWLVTGALAYLILGTLAELNFPTLFVYTTAIFIGYGYAICVLGLQSPFEFTKNFDSWLCRQWFFVCRHLPRWLHAPSKMSDSKNKIIDLGTKQQHEEEERFVSAMLDKIVKEGEDALTWNEQQRLKRIYERKGL